MTSAGFGQGKIQGMKRGLESTNPISHSNFQLNLFFFLLTPFILSWYCIVC